MHQKLTGIQGRKEFYRNAGLDKANCFFSVMLFTSLFMLTCTKKLQERVEMVYYFSNMFSMENLPPHIFHVLGFQELF